MAARADDHDSNDRWSGAFVPVEPGQYVYAIEAWTDEFATWRHGVERKQNAGADVSSMPSRAPACSPRRRRAARTPRPSS